MYVAKQAVTALVSSHWIRNSSNESSAPALHVFKASTFVKCSRSITTFKKCYHNTSRPSWTANIIPHDPVVGSSNSYISFVVSLVTSVSWTVTSMVQSFFAKYRRYVFVGTFFTATQMWYLARLLPLMIGSKIDEEDPLGKLSINLGNYRLLLGSNYLKRLGSIP